MNKVASIIVTAALVVAMGIVIFGNSNKENTDTDAVGETKNVEIIDGVQYVRINAGGGYWPKVSTAKAGIPTKIIIKTDGTYDCSASLTIRSLGFQKILAQTGEEIIDVGVPEVGQPLQGICGMGMYNFKINYR